MIWIDIPFVAVRGVVVAHAAHLSQRTLSAFANLGFAPASQAGGAAPPIAPTGKVVPLKVRRRAVGQCPAGAVGQGRMVCLEYGGNMSKLERHRAELVLMCYIAVGGLSFVWAALHGQIIPAEISALLMGVAALAVLAIRVLYKFVTAHWRELQNGRAERLFAIGLLLVIYTPLAMLYRAN